MITWSAKLRGEGFTCKEKSWSELCDEFEKWTIKIEPFLELRLKRKYKEFQEMCRDARNCLSDNIYMFQPLDFERYVKRMIHMLEVVREEMEPEPAELDKLTSARKKEAKRSRRVFVVHGHDKEMKESVARMLTKIDFQPVILHEQPNMGRTIIEKFEEYSDVCYAVVLLSPDDKVLFGRGNGKEDLECRARQNVIFELGFFIGQLGRKYVAALYKEADNFAMPTDYSGVLYIPFKEGWEMRLVQELKSCGYDVDANKLLS